MGDFLIVVDAGPIVALADRDDALHDSAREFFGSTVEALIVSPFVVAEADYLIHRQLGIESESRMLNDVANGVFRLEPVTEEDIRRCVDLIGQYRDLHVGLADASMVVIAHRYGTKRIATFDHRHFRAMRALDGQSFVILPADEQ